MILPKVRWSSPYIVTESYCSRRITDILTVRSTRFAGRSSGFDADFVSTEVWFAVAATGWGLSGMAPEDFTRSL